MATPVPARGLYCAVFCLLIASTGRSGGTVPVNQEIEYDAARIALVALLAGRGADMGIWLHPIRVAPDDQTVNLYYAARRLADLPKPVACSASLEMDVLAVSCLPLSDADARRAHDDYRARLWRFVCSTLDLEQQASNAEVSEVKILIESGNDRFVVSAESVRRWLDTYDLPAFNLWVRSGIEGMPIGVAGILNLSGGEVTVEIMDDDSVHEE